MLSNLPDAGENWHWELVCPTSGGVLVSVVGGDFRGLHGDGKTTFEMWDFAQPDPQGWLTADAINDYLRTHSISTEPAC